MALEASARSASPGRTALPGWLVAAWRRAGPLIAVYLLFIPSTSIRAIADDRGLPVNRTFNAFEGVVLTAAPNRWLQDALLGLEPLRLVAVAIYFSWMLLPVMVIVPLLRAGRVGDAWRMAWFLLAAHYVAQPFFFLYPVEPPWMHYSDIPRVQDLVFSRTSGADANPFAAMPSLHAAMPLMAALWFPRASLGRRLLLGYTALIAVTVIYTGDHYVADIIAGWALAGAYVTVVRLSRLPLLPERAKRRSAVVPAVPLQRAA